MLQLSVKLGMKPSVRLMLPPGGVGAVGSGNGSVHSRRDETPE